MKSPKSASDRCRRRKPIATSLEEACAHVVAGNAPSRPRNSFERIARSNPPRGRRASPNSKTAIAADLAEYLIGCMNFAPADAIRKAAAMTQADPANIRKYLRMRKQRSLECYRPTIANGLWPLVLPEVVRPRLVSVEDVTP